DGTRCPRMLRLPRWRRPGAGSPGLDVAVGSRNGIDAPRDDRNTAAGGAHRDVGFLEDGRVADRIGRRGPEPREVGLVPDLDRPHVPIAGDRSLDKGLPLLVVLRKLGIDAVLLAAPCTRARWVASPQGSSVEEHDRLLRVLLHR